MLILVLVFIDVVVIERRFLYDLVIILIRNVLIRIRVSILVYYCFVKIGIVKGLELFFGIIILYRCFYNFI